LYRYLLQKYVKYGSFMFMYKIVHIFVFVFVSFRRILYICISFILT